VNQMINPELEIGYMQPGGWWATDLTRPWEKLKSFFRDMIISEGIWAPRSPDFIPPDFFLWGSAEGLGPLKANLALTEDLKWNITN
jgi:hypothetical protein